MNPKEVKINSKLIGEGKPTFVIAEVGINHGGDLQMAETLILAAAEAGADAVKFQTYVTEKRVSSDSPVFDILKKCELTYDDHYHLKALADSKGVVFFSTPFDLESAIFLNEMDIAVFKIASFDIVNLDLVKQVASFGKPVIMSRGMANKNEIDAALNVLGNQNTSCIVLHCVSSYPTLPHEANLNVIKTLKSLYDFPIGYSDHTIGIDAALYSVAIGANVIEKHFTIDKTAPGPDHALSANKSDLGEMVKRLRELEQMLGAYDLKVYPAEEGTLEYRRYT